MIDQTLNLRLMARLVFSIRKLLAPTASPTGIDALAAIAVTPTMPAYPKTLWNSWLTIRSKFGFQLNRLDRFPGVRIDTIWRSVHNCCAWDCTRQCQAKSEAKDFKIKKVPNPCQCSLNNYGWRKWSSTDIQRIVDATKVGGSYLHKGITPDLNPDWIRMCWNSC